MNMADRKNKRKADSLVDSTSQPDIKRVKKEEPDDDEAARKSLLATRPTAKSQLEKHPRYWYPDGTIVVVVEKTAFKLNGTRLAKHSAVVASALDKENRRVGKLDGCAVCDVKGLAVADFEVFLEAFERPFGIAATDMPQGTAFTLFRASTTLGCARGLALSGARALTFWPPDIRSPLPDPFSLEDAFATIRSGVPGMHPRVLYELACSSEFWKLDIEERKAIIEEAKWTLGRMRKAMARLTDMWEAGALVPPGSKDGFCMKAIDGVRRAGVQDGGTIGQTACRRRGREHRLQLWSAWLGKDKGLEQGRKDPLGLLRSLATKLPQSIVNMGWCKHCMGAQRGRWEEQRAKMWEAWNGFVLE